MFTVRNESSRVPDIAAKLNAAAEYATRHSTLV
jgi:hypothetical protein